MLRIVQWSTGNVGTQTLLAILRNPGLELRHADLLPQGWEAWKQWNDFLFSGTPLNPHNTAEERAQVERDRGRYLGFIRMVGARKAPRSTILSSPIQRMRAAPG